MTLIDTNVLLDLATDDPAFVDWSLAQLEAAALRGPLLINDVIYAELSVRYERIEDLDTFVGRASLRREAIPTASLFLAGKAFRSYRKAGGARTGVLPDFFIGAHAAVRGHALLTRDRGRFATYFPTVALIEPKQGMGGAT